MHIDALPGATLVAKHKHFCELDASEWHKLAVNNGFHYKLTEGSIYVLPAGFMLMFMNRAEPEEDPEKAVCEYLRTSIYGSDLNMAASLEGAKRIVKAEAAPPGATYNMLIEHLSMKMMKNDVEDETPPKKSRKGQF